MGARPDDNGEGDAVSRARKATAVVPTLDNGMGDEMLAIDFREMHAKCIRVGCSAETAGVRAAQLVVWKIGNRAGHTLSQQGNASECAKCSAYGTTVHRDGGWQCTHDFSKRCGS